MKTVRGHNADVVLGEHTITLLRRPGRSFGFPAEIHIVLADVAAVHFVAPTWIRGGWVQIDQNKQRERLGLARAANDATCVTFHGAQRTAFETLRSHLVGEMERLRFQGVRPGTYVRIEG